MECPKQHSSILITSFERAEPALGKSHRCWVVNSLGETDHLLVGHETDPAVIISPSPACCARDPTPARGTGSRTHGGEVKSLIRVISDRIVLKHNEIEMQRSVQACPMGKIAVAGRYPTSGPSALVSNWAPAEITTVRPSIVNPRARTLPPMTWHGAWPHQKNQISSSRRFRWW